MTALPTRKLEAYRYADTDALASIWSSLPEPELIRVAANETLQQVWLPSGDAVEVRRARVELAAGSEAELFALNTARTYGRVELEVFLGEGSRFHFDAANLGVGTATLEVVTNVRHLEPGAVSRQVVRSVLGGKATGSYLGKVHVARSAQQTDGEQSVKAMLLDRGATANCKPELEIYADDVKCAHGASVGELDPDQLFYALSRGLPPAEAKALLLEGFVLGLWDEVADEMTREALCVHSRAMLREVAR
ncbi:SufD family Fe-S cluster assembly protein [Sphingomonas ginkgonis]|uniref:SufD family Fe-S cluster assembly protein n=1 Tax=Sphingomonas ginkgonis TaxID=2315330 RepID=A0A3S0EKC9_9SPHN|nr:SufD family Fe-S cluster assembly protein [Sphingomonas ginkgonis]RST29650.1 SufD family Fe-S cluster assembly protein [Sphingomonas ginkgonis]